MPGEKPLRAGEKTNNKLNPHSHIWRRRRDLNPTTLVGGERSRPRAITCSPKGRRKIPPPTPPPKRKEKPPAMQADLAIKFPSTTRHSTTHVPQVDLRMKTQATLGCIRRFLT